MLREHGATERIDLDLPTNVEPRALKAKVKASNPREQRTDR
jgi:hypothetical protein